MQHWWYDEEVIWLCLLTCILSATTLAGLGYLMSTLADLDAEIKGELTAAVTAIVAKIAALEAAVAAGTDTSAQVAELHTLATNLQNAVTPPATPPA